MMLIFKSWPIENGIFIGRNFGEGSKPWWSPPPPPQFSTTLYHWKIKRIDVSVEPHTLPSPSHVITHIFFMLKLTPSPKHPEDNQTDLQRYTTMGTRIHPYDIDTLNRWRERGEGLFFFLRRDIPMTSLFAHGWKGDRFGPLLVADKCFVSSAVL